MRKVSNPESVSDHSFRMAVMAMFFAKELKCNELKLLKLVLAHDLAESVCGDLVLDYSGYFPDRIKHRHVGFSKQEKEKIERKAVEELSSMLPQEHAGEFMALWEEFEEGKTREARIANELDKLEMLLQASEYERERNGIRPLFVPFVQANGMHITDRQLKDLLAEVKARTNASGKKPGEATKV